MTLTRLTAMVMTIVAALLARAYGDSLPVSPPPSASTREVAVSLDVKDADVRTIAQALADLADLQIVFDPQIACRLTLNVKALALDQVLDTTLRACGLSGARDGRVLRITTTARLTAEADERRALGEARQRRPPSSTTLIRLSYARAQELAPLIQRLLSPHGTVSFDARTNTLIIVD